MGLMIKHSLKNIFSKPLRLLLLVFCISFASLTALLAVDMKNNIQDLLKGYMLDMIGKMDIVAYQVTGEEIDRIDDLATVKRIGINSVQEYEYKRDPSSYSYSFETPISVSSISDLGAAYEMCILPQKYELEDESVLISTSYAEKFEKSVGDTVHFETRDEVDIPLKVLDVVTLNNSFLSGDFVIVSTENMRRISCLASTDYNCWFLDVEDDAKIQEVADVIRDEAPGAELEVISELVDNPDIESLYNMFYLLFLISFLLVIFVTTSMAEKIVNERMSVIGTLRSLGVTQGKTAILLLIENIIYAVIGTVIGIAVYSAVKPGMLGSMMNLSTSSGEKIDPAQYFGATPIYVYLTVLAGAIIIECAYPLFELAKAVKTPIRDIIFDNKDTEFKYRWGRLYTGITLLAVSLVSGLLVKNFFTLALSFAFGVVALAVLIPFLIRIISKGLTALFKKVSFPVAQLASENISRNRIIMGTAVLCVTSLTLALLIEGIGKALTGDIVKSKYDSDLMVDIYVNDEDHDYRYLNAVEGISEIDYVYESPANAAINNEKKRVWSVFADSPHTMFKDLPADGYGLKADEIVMSEAMAKRIKVKIGDEVKLVFDPNTDFPIEKNFVIKDLLNTNDTMIFSFESLIINRDLYDHMFTGRLSTILLNADDPESVKEIITKNSESYALKIKTRDELNEEQQENSGGMLTVLRLVVAGSVVLTMIGIAGNQSIGFLTRKRETALLYSVAMPRHKLKRLIFLESLFSMGISAVVAVIASPFLYRVLVYLLDVISDGDIGINNTNGIGLIWSVVYLAIILAVFLLTTLIPSGYLKKMNIAEELKYE